MKHLKAYAFEKEGIVCEDYPNCSHEGHWVYKAHLINKYGSLILLGLLLIVMTLIIILAIWNLIQYL